MTKIPVLMYHALDSPTHPAGSKNAGEQLYVLDVLLFEKQLQYLKKFGYSTVLLEELLAGSDLSLNTLVLTFDDGHVSNHTLALPLLIKYGFVAEFFITTGRIGKENYLTEEQINDLAYAGMGIGSHGVTHEYLDGLDADALQSELGDSKEQLKNIIGKDVISFSAPGGRINKEVTRVATRLCYKIQCSSQIGLAQSGNINTIIPRVAVKRRTTHKEFVNIVGCSSRYFFVNRLRYNMLNIIKKILGSQRYSKLHSLISMMKTL